MLAKSLLKHFCSSPVHVGGGQARDIEPLIQANYRGVVDYSKIFTIEPGRGAEGRLGMKGEGKKS